ncbi:MAG TPA: hypothetical protein VGP89_01585, partial [Candidatus Angelobacter sp.]|nr:hypothetical protein [Candidatus Angelobacter sp.]
MRPSQRFTSIFLFIFGLTATALAQTPAPADDGAAAALANSIPGYADKAPASVNLGQSMTLQPVTSATILDFPANADSSRAI